jgi:hypothetical protein
MAVAHDGDSGDITQRDLRRDGKPMRNLPDVSHVVRCLF